MSWKRAAKFDGGVLVEPFAFTPEHRAELAALLVDRPALPALIHELETCTAFYIAHSKQHDPRPGPIATATRRIDREAARLLDAGDEADPTELRRVFRETDVVTLERLRFAAYEESARTDVLWALRDPGAAVRAADVLTLRAACARVLDEAPTDGGRPRNQDREFLTDRVAEVLRRHGVDMKVWRWEDESRGGQFVGVLAIVLRAVGFKTSARTAFRLAREARPER